MASGNRYTGLPSSLINIASKKARELCNHRYFTQDDFNDLQQELIIDLYVAIQAYEFQVEAEKRAFAKTVVDNKAKKLIRDRASQKRGGDLFIYSLHDPVSNDEDDAQLLIDTIHEDANFYDYQRALSFDAMEFEIDLERAVNLLPDDLWQLYKDLQTMTLEEISELRGISYFKVYRMSNKLRTTLMLDSDENNKDS